MDKDQDVSRGGNEEVPDVALKKVSDDEGSEKEGEDSKPEITTNVLKAAVPRVRQHVPRQIDRKAKIIDSEVTEEPLERIVEDESVEVGTGGLSAREVNYESSGSSQAEVRRGVGGMRSGPEQMYDVGGREEEGFYETGHVDINPVREGAWSTNQSLPRGGFMEEVRAVGGREVIDPSKMVEGETFRGEGNLDGFSGMRLNKQKENNY